MASNQGGYTPRGSSHQNVVAFNYQPPLPPKEPINNYEENADRKIEEQTSTITRNIELTRGNLVIDCPVPVRELFSGVPYDDKPEFTSIRYTACTCDPDDFKDRGYTLRQPPEQIRLLIAITMYNENEVLLSRTLYGITQNIRHICTKRNNPNAWREVVVCIISDGRRNVSQRVLAYLAVLGVYQDGIIQTSVNDRAVSAHLFEYTTQIAIDPSMNIKTASDGIVPVQILFCLKEENKKKINSHRWFFNAFGSVLEPEICVLVDVGTKPGYNSINDLWRAFDNPYVAGVCGEIVATKGKGCVKLLNPIVGAQNFEYKMSNILDKPFESVFGYVTVLPGAFSAYRYIALQNIKRGEGQREEGPLASYFKFETDNEDGNAPVESILTANMYLAEDRILCFELVTKRQSSWILRYIKYSQAETDIPEDLPELISQRRRWLNGTFFASFYAITHFYYIFRSDHSFIRKGLFCIEMFYQALNLFFSWFALANFYLAFYILGSTFQNESNNGDIGFPSVPLSVTSVTKYIFMTLDYIYSGLIIIQFIISMGNRPQGSKWIHTISAILFGVIMIYLTFTGVWLTIAAISTSIEKDNGFILQNLIHDFESISIVISLIATYGLYLISSIMMLDPWHMFTCIIQYTLLIPFYINILNVYAFCNIHDVSWGTKGPAVRANNAIFVRDKAGIIKAQVTVPDENIVKRAHHEAYKEINRKEHEVKRKNRKDKQEDSQKTFRTLVLFLWIFTNALLIIAIRSDILDLIMYKQETQDSKLTRFKAYVLFIFWSITGLTDNAT
ncbi:10516_t:CDS:2 [Cetraspora pellucida]|uniref:Chitin synthase n=1 Tax=Cetraspora pellucida TaxID=1433469 RepID=A0A9N8WSA9_9GLOM|nr:10516_t:CDS:2 [Cetraspora pellucida]